MTTPEIRPRLSRLSLRAREVGQILTYLGALVVVLALLAFAVVAVAHGCAGGSR